MPRNYSRTKIYDLSIILFALQS